MKKLLLTAVTATGLLSGCFTSREHEAREHERERRFEPYCDPAQQACDCPPGEPCRPYGYYGTPPVDAPPGAYGRGHGEDRDEDADADRRHRQRREAEERERARDHREREDHREGGDDRD